MQANKRTEKVRGQPNEIESSEDKELEDSAEDLNGWIQCVNKLTD